MCRLVAMGTQFLVPRSSKERGGGRVNVSSAEIDVLCMQAYRRVGGGERC